MPRLCLCRVLLLLGLCAAAASADEPELRIVIQGHRFAPPEIRVQAGKRLKLVVENLDATPEEFESYALNREKIVAPAGRAIIYVGPLDPGRYEFFGDFNPDSARGWLVAVP